MSRVLDWSLRPAEWEQVAAVLDELDRRRVEHDRLAFGRARDHLARLGMLQARRFGAAPEPGRRPVPPPVRERLNTLIHRLGVPGEGGDGDDAAAGEEGELGRTSLAAAVHWTIERALSRLPVFDRASVAFASTDDERARDVPGHEAVVDGMRILRRDVSPSSVEVVVIAGSEGQPGDVLALAAGPQTDHVLFLLPLWLDVDNRLVSTIEVPTHAISLDDAVTRPFPGAWLGETDAEAVSRSVRLTGRPGRNAWRDVARSRPAGDPVRSAVIEGLR